MIQEGKFLVDIVELARRQRRGFRAFSATVDLLGISTHMRQFPREALQRINDLQQGFAEALAFYPGGCDYRVCFAGDSVFAIRELEPEEPEAELWAHFVGHLFALTSFLQGMELCIGNPGLRVIISYGNLFQIFEPSSWSYPLASSETKNWFVLTGGCEALKKCTDAEKIGTTGGFEGGFCWHEREGEHGRYFGTRFRKISLENAQRPDLYPVFYLEMCARAESSADLGSENLEPSHTDPDHREKESTS